MRAVEKASGNSDSERTTFNGKSWMDVVRAVPAGRMSIGDATKSVTYLDTYAGLRKVLDLEYFKRIAAEKPPFLLRSEQSVRCPLVEALE